MLRKVMLKEVISVVKLSLSLTWCWPLPRDATKLKMLCEKLYHYLSIILSIGVATPMIYAVINHTDDPLILIKLIPLISGTFHSISNFIFYRVNYRHIQNVTFEMIHFNDLMKPHEEIIIQRYVDKCIIFHGASIFIFYFAAIASLIVPSVTEQTFPTLAEYPFDVFYQPLKTIIYIQQSFAALMISGQLCINIFMALLLWFATARFEILAEEFGKVTNIYQSFKCIKKHQELLKYAEEVAISARPFAFSTICCSGVNVITVFLLLLTHQPLIIIIQFFGMVLIALSEIFMYTWSAEHLMNMSYNVGQVAFDMLDDNNLIEIWKCLLIIIMRSQKPIIVRIPCLMPALSLNYFTTYLSTAVSYFTTLRVLIDDSTN